MTQIDIINKFLARSDLGETELILKTRVIGLDHALATARKDLEELTTKTNEKQNEVLASTQQLQALLGLILDIQNQKDSSTQPLQEPSVDEVVGE